MTEPSERNLERARACFSAKTDDGKTAVVNSLALAMDELEREAERRGAEREREACESLLIQKGKLCDGSKIWTPQADGFFLAAAAIHARGES